MKLYSIKENNAMAKQTVSTKPEKVYGYINRDTIRHMANIMNYGVENPVGKKETILKVVGAAKEFDISIENVVQCTMGNTEGYVINQDGLFRLIKDNMVNRVEEHEKKDYIPVVVEYSDKTDIRQ